MFRFSQNMKQIFFGPAASLDDASTADSASDRPLKYKAYHQSDFQKNLCFHRPRGFCGGAAIVEATDDYSSKMALEVQDQLCNNLEKLPKNETAKRCMEVIGKTYMEANNLKGKVGECKMDVSVEDAAEFIRKDSRHKSARTYLTYFDVHVSPDSTAKNAKHLVSFKKYEKNDLLPLCKFYDSNGGRIKGPCPKVLEIYEQNVREYNPTSTHVVSVPSSNNKKTFR